MSLLFVKVFFPHLFQLYVLMEHSINMSSLTMETVIGRLLMSILTSVMMMISKDEVSIQIFKSLYEKGENGLCEV